VIDQFLQSLILRLRSYRFKGSRLQVDQSTSSIFTRSQDISKSVVLGVCGESMRETSGEVLEDILGDLHRALWRKYSSIVAQTDRERHPRRWQCHPASSADRVRHRKYEWSGDERSAGSCEGYLHRWVLKSIKDQEKRILEYSSNTLKILYNSSLSLITIENAKTLLIFWDTLN